MPQSVTNANCITFGASSMSSLPGNILKRVISILSILNEKTLALKKNIFFDNDTVVKNVNLNVVVHGFHYPVSTRNMHNHSGQIFLCTHLAEPCKSTVF